MKRAAITGIAGQDGTYLARGLLRRGYEVHGLLQFPFDREEPVLRRRYPADEFNAVRWQTGSLEDPFSLVRFLKRGGRFVSPKPEVHVESKVVWAVTESVHTRASFKTVAADVRRLWNS